MKARQERPRDQGVSAISAILMRLCEAGGLLGAALVDAEGETVDYSGRFAPYDIRVAAAEWRIVGSLILRSRVPGWARLEELVVRSSEQSFALRVLSDGYALVMVLPRRAFGVSERAVAEATEELRREVGLSPVGETRSLRWRHVEVHASGLGGQRPEQMWRDGAWRRITILGRVPDGLGRGEVGYLVRLENGAELLLVREPLGKWFTGEPA
jgi:hypothetical protein